MDAHKNHPRETASRKYTSAQALAPFSLPRDPLNTWAVRSCGRIGRKCTTRTPSVPDRTSPSPRGYGSARRARRGHGSLFRRARSWVTKCTKSLGDVLFLPRRRQAGSCLPTRSELDARWSTPVSILQRVASVAAFGERLAYLARSACEQKARGHCSAPSVPRSLLRLARHELARRLDEDWQHEPVHRS